MVSNKTVYLSVNRRIPPTFGVGKSEKGRPEEIGNWVMQSRGRKLPILERYEGFLSTLLPHIKAMLVDTRQTDFRLGLSENALPGMSPVANWSSGTSHLAIFLGAMSALPPGSVILAEEPELSLHPAAIRQLMEEVRGLADAKQLQFFLTTHSGIVVEQLDPHSKSHALWRFNRNSDGSASAARCETEKEIDEAITSLRLR
jgi:predicted ATPase